MSGKTKSGLWWHQTLSPEEREAWRIKRRSYTNAYYKRNAQKLRVKMRKWRAANKDKVKAYSQRYEKQKGKEVSRLSHIRRAYGLSEKDFSEAERLQDGLCAICCEPPLAGQRLHVDHDHKTDMFRALLCGRCNRGLGFFREQPELFLRAVAYLKVFAKEEALKG